MSLNQCVSIRSVNQRNILRGWFYVIITLQPLLPDKSNVSDQLEALQTPASIGYPGADGGAVELLISGGGGAGYFLNSPSYGPSSQITTNLLAKWKVSPEMVAEEKETSLYERPWRVTWD